jgi:hypothetical protein
MPRWRIHPKVNVQIERTDKTLDQRDRTGVRRGCCITGFPNLVRGNSMTNDTQHFAHDGPDWLPANWQLQHDRALAMGCLCRGYRTAFTAGNSLA